MRDRGNRRSALVLAAAALLGATAATGADRTPKLEKSHADRTHGFRIDYPADWTCEADGNSVSFSGPKGTAAWYTHFGVHAVATRTAGGQHADADALLTHLRERIGATCRDVKCGEAQKSPYPLGGVRTQARLLVVDYTRPERDLRMRTMFFLVSPPGGRRIFTMTYTAPHSYRGEAVFDACLPTVSAMVNSFALTADAPAEDAPPALELSVVHVRTASGIPAPGSGAVTLDGTRRAAEIGHNGRVAFDRLPPGRYRGVVLWNGYKPVKRMVLVQPGEDVVLVLPDGAKVPPAGDDSSVRRPAPAPTPASAKDTAWPVKPQTQEERVIVERVSALIRAADTETEKHRYRRMVLDEIRRLRGEK